jgi:hypothetical protein
MPMAVVSLGSELTAAAVVFAAGVVLGALAHLSLGLLVRVGDEAVWWWELWMRAARLVRGAGIAVALLSGGRWAIARWFPTAQAELDVVLIAVAIMVVWEAGGFVVPVRRLRLSEIRPAGDRPTGAAVTEQRPGARLKQSLADVGSSKTSAEDLEDVSTGY